MDEEEERKAKRRAWAAGYREKNRQRLRDYQRQWCRENKAVRKAIQMNKTKQEKMDMIEQAEKFIERIEKQHGYCDEIDGFILTGIYSDLFGSAFYRKYPDDMESELSYMYLELKNNIDKMKYKVESIGDYHETKKCYVCGKTKPHTEFHLDRKQKDNRAAKCKPCKAKYQKDYLDKNPEKREYYKSKYYNKRKKKK